MMLLPKKKRERKKHETAVPTDSMGDIAFLLIIFFILTTTIQKMSGITTEFPASDKTETQQQQQKTPTIALHDGNINFNDKPVSLDELKKQLAGLQLHQKAGSEKVVVFEATGQVNYQQYFEVMSAISASGGVMGIVREEEKGR